MIDDDVLNGDENAENHRADNIIAAHHETAEGLNHVAGGGSSGISVEQNEPRGRYVERQAEQRQQQQYRGEDAEFNRTADIHGHHHHDDGHHQIQHQQDVQHEAGQRRNQCDDDEQYGDGYGEFADARDANHLQGIGGSRSRTTNGTCLSHGLLGAHFQGFEFGEQRGAL